MQIPALSLNLVNYATLVFKQRFEVAEFLGYETRNKYDIETDSGTAVGFAAEQQKGVGGFLMRQFFGHWRSFSLHFYTANRLLALVANHPFRFFFQRLEVTFPDGRPLGAIQQRFSLLSKRFDVENFGKQVHFEVDSPLWSPWTFTFTKGGREVATVRKRWSGLFSEAMSDRDNFAIGFSDPSLSEIDRSLVLVAALFIDLQYFERKAGNRRH